MGVWGNERTYQINKKDLISLIGLEKLGPVTCTKLLQAFGSPEAILGADLSSLTKVSGIGKKLASNIINRNKSKGEEEILFANKNGIDILSVHEKEYPRILKDLSAAPFLLFKKGKLDFNHQPAISIVGTRTPSRYGSEVARRYASFFASKGFNIVSGLAHGIDYEAHRAALDAGGVTTAVLGHGLDIIYPFDHISLSERVINEGGALLTEFVSGTKPDAFNFPARNRIISGLSLATIVIEARSKGGALITANFAFDQNREVYALPGNINVSTSAGCNHLIKNNIAKLTTCPEEIYEDLLPMLEKNGRCDFINKQKNILQLTQIEQDVLSILNGKEIFSIEEFKELFGNEISNIMDILFGLEMKNIINRLPGNYFRKIAG